MKKRWLFGALGFGLSGLLMGLGAAQQRTLTVITHDSFNLDKALLVSFERRENIRVRFIKGGDAGAMVNKLVLSKKNPLADAVFGIDNTLLGRALKADILAPYRPARADLVPGNLRLDAAWRLTPVDYGFVTLNYDKAWFSTHQKPLPKRLEDLTRPEYRGLVVTANPATSSPGLAFYLATLKTLGEKGALAYWAGLRQNDLKVVSGWDAAYYTEFTQNGGSRPIVVSYASSPAAEVFYSKKKLEEAPTANLLLPGSSWLQIEGAAVLKGAKNPDLARKFVDFMLTDAVQADIPTQMWVYPALRGVKLNPVYRFAEKPSAAQTATLSAATVTANETRWVSLWTRVVVQGADPSSLK